MSAPLTEARVREIVREELAAVFTYLTGGRLDPQTGELVPVKQPPEGYDLRLQSSNGSDDPRCGVKEGLVNDPPSLNPVNERTGDDLIGSEVKESFAVTARAVYRALLGHESSPSLDGLDTPSVGDDPAPGDGFADPGADGQGAPA